MQILDIQHTYYLNVRKRDNLVSDDVFLSGYLDPNSIEIQNRAKARYSKLLVASGAKF